MGHQISHRFTKTFRMMSSCDFCEKQMFIGTGLSCKECKFRCHKECGPKVPPSCGLPQGFVDEFKKLFLPESELKYNNLTIISVVGVFFNDDSFRISA